jgi:hypothetical protein
MKPLNGTKTHPLSVHALQVLSAIANTPMPRQTVNPGVANRLLRESLVETQELASPFKAHKGGTCEFLCITEAGRQVIKKGTP